ncbi:MAG: CHAT domain-containing tetratricopeptide repeat protein, partial [Chloroflexota bacterium]|nr:CHAT domain-containing tetratricopeptide repeat protein [Chloroflexota bacterium]
ANAYADRIRGDRADNIERAIHHYNQALEIRTRQAFPKGWAATQNNLGEAYRNRIRGERAENIERAIHHYSQTLEVRTRQAFPAAWAMTQNNIALAYADRIRGDRAKNIERAIHHYTLALEIYTRQADTERWAAIQNNLAIAYRDHIRGDQAENIERAIHHYSLTLEIYTRQANPERWAATQNNLANAYYSRIRGDQAENVERAIHHYTLALEVQSRQTFPADWAQTMNNLATVYSDRIRGNRAENVERAIHHYTHALKVYTRQAFPDEHRITQRNLASLCFGENRWAEAIAAYRGALSASDLLYRAAATPEARRAELREIRNLPARLAYALSQITTPSGDGAQLRDAVLTLEQNRARWLSEALSLRRERPGGVPDEIWRAFVSHREQIGQFQAEARLPEKTPGKRDFLTLTAELRAAYTALNESVDDIHRHAPDFMPTPTFYQIQAAVTPGQPLIYFAVSPAETVALVVTPQAIHPIHCDLTEDELREHIQDPDDGPELGGYLSAYAAWRQSPRDPATRKVWHTALDDTAHWLWDALMGPVVRTLTDLDITRATLIPSGWLAFLPLHAAWTETNGKCHYALDRITFSYAPSARALAHARTAAAATSGTRLFAVDNPDDSLEFSQQEVDEVARHFSGEDQEPFIVRRDWATRNTALHALPECDVYHFACHGSNARNAPLESALWLYGDLEPLPLTVRDLLEQRGTQARLAFLSACETGLVGADLPDEVVGLASGFLQAGAAGIVSTLWAVNDRSTALLAERFYAHWKGDGMEPADALAAAQRWLRDEAEGGRYAHPYYWAGFTLTGV